MSGARWNPPGSAVVYSARTYEGAILEQLVHAGIGRLPRNRVVSKIRIPEDSRIEVLGSLGDDLWIDESRTRATGQEWLEGSSSLALVVPSMVARPFGENVLINPAHPDFRKVEVIATIPVSWDPRLWRGQPGEGDPG